MKKTIKLEIPPQLEMLCSLLDTTIERVIQGFINDVSLAQGSNGSDERMMATDYFLRCGYGMHIFDYEQLGQMISGLNDIRYNVSSFGNSQIDAYRRYVKKELKIWHTYWLNEKARKTSQEKGQ